MILSVEPLGFPWVTRDPFLFCVHHDDAYPPGDERMGPAASLEGRRIGMDFDGIDGWRMYHGDVVPGFPRHPHRGFETVTLARVGYIDHSDSLGATARFGRGDVQWMTAGAGIVHAEMFPLVNRNAGNPTELFQIWLNLPRADKMVDPHFTMLWSEDIGVARFDDGAATTVTAVAGPLAGIETPPPPPSSWAARPDAEVIIWPVVMEAGARWTAPASSPGCTRMVYVFAGDGVDLSGTRVTQGHAAEVRADADLPIANTGERTAELLILGGRPIGEPVVQYGPFVMNRPTEIQQAIADYRRTEFGGWPWSSDGPVHDRERGRFAIHADGRVDEP
jgi:hypothetical protein